MRWFLSKKIFNDYISNHVLYFHDTSYRIEYLSSYTTYTLLGIQEILKINMIGIANKRYSDKDDYHCGTLYDNIYYYYKEI